MSRTRRFWRADEIALLASMYPECHTEDVAAWLECPVKRVYAAAKARGIRKSPEFLASETAGRIQRGRSDPRMVATQFRPGQKSWNKGVKGSTGLHENCRRTQFKPGRLAHEARNYVPLGSHRLSKDGYLERKVTDDPSIFPARRWIAVHRLVWEAAHGPIPKGHAVCFKAGQRTAVWEDITADRLECIPRAELARRNHPRERSPELAKLVQLKGAITRQVNRIAREAQERNA
jgi:hypothetical protein